MWAPLPLIPWKNDRPNSNEALAAACAKQPPSVAVAPAGVPVAGALVASMSKSAAPAPPVAPWHRAAPSPPPPGASPAPWQTPKPLPAPPKSTLPVPLVERVAGALNATVSSPQTISEYRSRLVKIYSIHRPSNVAQVDYLLNKYKNQEEFLYTSVCSKYSISPSWDGQQPLPLPVRTRPPPNANSVATARATSTTNSRATTSASPVRPVQAPEGDVPPWAVGKRKALSATAPPKAKAKVKDPEQEAKEISEALAALQTLTEDLTQAVPKTPPETPKAAASAVPKTPPAVPKTPPAVVPKTPPAVPKTPPEVPREEPKAAAAPKGAAEPQGPAAETVAESEDPPKPAGPAEASAATAPAAPARRPPTPPRPRRRMAEEVTATDPRRRILEEDDDEEVVVVSVDGRDPGHEMEEDEKLGEQMRKALGASLTKAFAKGRADIEESDAPQMALPVEPVVDPPDVGDPPDAVPGGQDDARRAAAAAAARGLAVQSDSDSESEYSSMSSEEAMAEPVQTVPPPGASSVVPAKASKEATANGRKKANRKKEDPAVRNKLLGQIFLELSNFCGTPKRVTVKGMQRFVTMVGFEGSDNEWQTEYLSLCKEWKTEPSKGFNQAAFNKMVDDQSPRGCYCTNEELKIILGKIMAAPKLPKSQVRKQSSPPAPPPKKQKVEVQFQ